MSPRSQPGSKHYIVLVSCSPIGFSKAMSVILYVATSSAGKLRDFEIAARTGTGDFRFLPLPGLNDIPPPVEDASTFEENARLKAIEYSHHGLGQIVIADDSGLEVDALDGAPGVRSARYAADAGFDPGGQYLPTDEINNQFLIGNLRDIPTAKRTARYRCALAAARDGNCICAAQGSVEGQILNVPRGSGGFGYDPFFYLPDLGQTMAEIDPVHKLRFSHRGHAVRNLLQQLSALKLA